MPGTKKGKAKVLSAACRFVFVVVKPLLTNTFRRRMQAFEAQGELLGEFLHLFGIFIRPCSVVRRCKPGFDVQAGF